MSNLEKTGAISPYQEALNWMQRHPGTGSANSLAKLVLSLWNQECAYSFRECVGNLDSSLTQLAVRMATHFAKRGEDQELVQVGYQVCEAFPRLWDLGQAADQAKEALRDKWREADAKEDAEEASASDAAAVPQDGFPRIYDIGSSLAHAARFNPIARFAEEADHVMALLVQMARLGGVEVSADQTAMAKELALAEAEKGKTLTLLALVTAWEPVPELADFARALRGAAIPGPYGVMFDEYHQTAHDPAYNAAIIRLRRCLDVGNFLADMKAAGVVIEGEEALSDALEGAAANWRQEAVEQARSGSKQGVRFLRRQEGKPTADELLAIMAILARHRFTDEQAHALAMNVIDAKETRS